MHRFLANIIQEYIGQKLLKSDNVWPSNSQHAPARQQRALVLFLKRNVHFCLEELHSVGLFIK